MIPWTTLHDDVASKGKTQTSQSSDADLPRWPTPKAFVMALKEEHLSRMDGPRLVTTSDQERVDSKLWLIDERDGDETY